MAPNKDASGPMPFNHSTDTSPTDTRAPHRFESITRSGDDDASTTTGSVASFNTAEEEQDDGQRTPTQEGSRQPVHSCGSSLRHQVLSPEPMNPSHQSKKPAMARRNSSKYQAPYRGQEFSVDDDPNEYESDVQQQKRSSVARAASGVGQSLRRQPSTLRRRPTAQPTNLPRVESQGEEEEEAELGRTPTHATSNTVREADETQETSGEEGTILGDADDEDEGELSDAESFTLKDRQNAINDTHPFGIRIWKPALYKKNRSVEKTAEGDIHSSPGGRVSRWLWVFNLLWTLLFGWWLALAAGLGAVICLVLSFTPGTVEYGRVLAGLAWYLFYPFGQFVRLEQDEAYAEEDEGEGRSISEYERWQNGDLEDGRLFFGPLTSRSLIGRRRSSIESSDENDSLLGRTRRGHEDDDQRMKTKRRLFGRGQWTFGRVIFFIFFYFLIAPLLLLTSLICWFMVFWIPMGKVTLLLFYHLRRHPLALSFNLDSTYSRGVSSPSSSILLCTYRAVGLKYWKYTIDGTNIFLINLIGVVLFAIFDYWVLDVTLGLEGWIVNPGFVFALALFSIIPLAYFIGQAVASISAQSSMGVGAAINAFFSTVVEVFLYCVALNQGKGQLVEGSIIGSIFAGILFLPGLSMCFGALKRKTQRFNVKSAGVTSTMLLFAIIAAFSPTLFYQIYGSHELNCHSCIIQDETDGDCRRCYFSQVPAIHDAFFLDAVRPYTWLAAVLLFLSYIVGLWFTLRTHAAVIWNNEVDEKKAPHAHGPNGSISHHPIQLQPAPPPKQTSTGSSKDTAGRGNAIRESPLYKRILQQSLRDAGLGDHDTEDSRQVSASSAPPSSGSPKAPHFVPPKSSGGDSTTAVDSASQKNIHISALSEQENQDLVRHVVEISAQAAALAARDATQNVRKVSAVQSAHHTPRRPTIGGAEHLVNQEEVAAEVAHGGGHDAPNWGRTKSAIILLGATILYAVIAEILVNTVDVVLESVDIDEKFLGITLFALVPNTTEFLNAISFAMNGNIALSMEIGSAYALQVCLLQIPALVLFSAIIGQNLGHADLLTHTFNLIFPQWDMVTVILCVFLLSYVYGEGKSNYFKGSILLLTYLVIVVGFYLAGYSSDIELMGIDRFDRLALGQNIRRQAELNLKSAEEQSGFINALLDILQAEQDNATRLSTVVYLKNRVLRGWAPGDEVNHHKQIPDPDKLDFRNRILPILATSPSQVRAQLIPILQKILQYDFPAKWPDFMDITMQLLNTNDANSVFAGLHCMLAICRMYRFKGGETRDDFNRIVSVSFPQLLRIGTGLVNETNPEGWEMLRIVLKAYKHTIYFELPPHLMAQDNMVGWCTLFLTFVGKEAPSAALDEDLDERERNHWFKSTKWAYANLNRLFVRYGNPSANAKNTTPELVDFSKFFITNFAPEILKGYLQQIERWASKTAWLSKPSLSYTLSFLDECVKPKTMWNHLKPHMDTLISHVLFPILCQSDEDLELFDADPSEYLHRKMNFYEEVTAPDVAAVNFLVSLTKSRKKQTFSILSFVNGLVSKYELLPDDQKSPREKEGALRMIGTLASVILGKKSPIADQVEYFFVRHVFPEFRSPHGFLRARACDTLSKFEQLEFKDPNNLLIIYRNILESMADPELPVRVEAALALQPMIRHEVIRASMQQNIPQIMQQLLKLANEVDVDALANVMEDFVEEFAAELTPFAVALSEQLRDTYLRIVRELLEKNSNKDEDETYGDFLDDKSITALGVLQTIGTLILTLEATPDVLMHLETILMPVIQITLENKLYDLYNEVFEIIDSCTFSAKAVSPSMWQSFGLMHKAFKAGAELYLEDMLPALDNFVTYGADVMIQNPTYADVLVSMVEDIFHDEKVGGMDRICGCKLAESTMLNLRGHIDRHIPKYVSLAMEVISSNEVKVKSYRIYLMEMIINAIYYSPTLALRTLESNGWTNKFFSSWFSNIEGLTRVHDKKLSIVAISALLILRADEVPSSVQQGWPRLLQGVVRLFQTLPAAMKNRDELTKEGEFTLNDDDDDDDQDAWEGEDAAWTNDLDEVEGEAEGDVADESAAYLDFLQEEAQKFTASEEEEELEEENLLETPLDKVEPYGVFKASLLKLQQDQPQLYDSLTKILGPEEQHVLQNVCVQADTNAAAIASVAQQQSNGV